MSDERTFSATSATGDLAQALSGAIGAAAHALNVNYFHWRLDAITGSVGGFMNARGVQVTIAVPKRGPVGALESENQIQCGDGHAWHDRMPGKPPTLYVVGRCIFPTTGYTVELRPVTPQGINPAVYILEKVVTAPTGPVLEVETVVPLYYREETRALYSHVHILPENAVIDVREVS